MNINTVLLVGNVTRDPELREVGAENRVAKFGLAVNRKFGKGEEEVLFVDVETWNKSADVVMEYAKKGDQLGVEGRLKLDQYTTKEGEKRQRLFVVANQIHLGPKKDREGEQPAPPARRPSRPAAAAPAPAANPFGGDDGLPF